MPPSVRVAVRPSVLSWARTRAGLQIRDLEPSFPRYRDWEAGIEQPTLRQLEQFAAKTHAPIGYLFLETPPKEILPIADFRTLSGETSAIPSPDLLETVYAIQRRQEFFKELLLEENAEPLKFVGSVGSGTTVEGLVASIRAVLRLSRGWARRLRNWESAFLHLRACMEDAGILVMTNGIVGSNTSRPLTVAEFRGFVLVDRYAPVVFVNNADAKSAQMFTLMHEAAHIWLGQSGLTGQEWLLPGADAIERLCDKAAAEFLVPADELQGAWPQKPDPVELSREFKVSPLVVARRALDLGLLPIEDFREIYRIQVANGKRKSKGGDFYSNAGARLGQRFPAAVYASVKNGRLSYTEAYELTDLRGSSFTKFGEARGY
jgi:Zn-dependent peptidase ImmA (M78 family)